ncbi:MAG: hypothetical protein ACRD3F_04850 [Acidobacteriaceae bacterium]
MAASISRLLKVRRLLEESARLELERRVALADRIERAEECELTNMHESRERAVAAIVDEGDSEQQQSYLRHAEWANADRSAVRRQMLRAMGEATESRVIEARMAFLERRTERRQVKSVLEAGEARARYEQERRIQRDLDDWFGVKQFQRKRNRYRDPL